MFDPATIATIASGAGSLFGEDGMFGGGSESSSSQSGGAFYGGSFNVTKGTGAGSWPIVLIIAGAVIVFALLRK